MPPATIHTAPPEVIATADSVLQYSVNLSSNSTIAAVEAFANRRACVFDRIAPLREDSLNVAVVAKGGEGQLLALETWRKEPVPITG